MMQSSTLRKRRRKSDSVGDSIEGTSDDNIYSDDDMDLEENAEEDKITNSDDDIEEKGWAMLEIEDPHENEDNQEDCKVFPMTVLHKERWIELNEGQRLTIAKGIAQFVLEVFWVNPWIYFRDYVGVDMEAFCSVREVVFKSLTKFVLNIFDMEDFQRVVEQQKIEQNCKAFYGRLIEHFGLLPESASMAMMAMSEQKILLDDFPFLREQDVGCILKWYQVKCADKDARQVPGPFIESPLIERFVVFEHYLKSVLDVVEEYVPLEEEHKMDLRMDMEQGCHLFVKAFSFEVWKDIHLEDLEKFSTDGDDENANWIADTITHSINNLGRLKAVLLSRSRERVTFPLVSCVFGEFTNEAVELVGIANLHRIIRGHRFISVQHILSGFWQSRIAKSVQKFFSDWGKTPFCKEDLEGNYPVYYIYKSSQDVAGVLGCQTVGLEHMFLAAFFSSRQGTDANQWKAIAKQEVVARFLEECVGNCRNKSSEPSPSSDGNDWSLFLPDYAAPGSQLEFVKFVNDAFKSGYFKPRQIAIDMQEGKKKTENE